MAAALVAQIRSRVVDRGVAGIEHQDAIAVGQRLQQTLERIETRRSPFERLDELVRRAREPCQLGALSHGAHIVACLVSRHGAVEGHLFEERHATRREPRARVAVVWLCVCAAMNARAAQQEQRRTSMQLLPLAHNTTQADGMTA